MAKLSNLFGRWNDEVGGRPGGGPAPRPDDDFADVGSRLGEENEVLRNLLNDTARKIADLDELKASFDKIVEPFNSVLRTLEQEKSQGLALSNMLNESRGAYETLRSEFYRVDKQATALGADAEKLRVDLEVARESNRLLEATQIELSNEISDYRTQVSELESKLAQETTAHRMLGETHRAVLERLDANEKRNTELDGDLADLREKLTLLDDNKRSVQMALDKALDESSRLGRLLNDSENTLTGTRAQLAKVEASYAEVYTERGQLAVALDELREQRQAEQNSLNMRLEALQSRAATAERLLSETRQNLIVRTEEVRAFDRKATEANIARNNSEKRLSQIEGMQELRDNQLKDIEKARAALAERNSAITKTLRARESALERAEEKVGSLNERNGRLEADLQVIRTNIEKRVEELNSALQRERMERAMTEGALEATRKDNARLQSEAASLRSILRRGLSLDDGPVAPDEPANDEATVKAKLGKNAESA